MEKSEAMTSPHLFAYSYQLFKKCFAEYLKNSTLHILFFIKFTSNFHFSVLNLLLFLLN